MPASFISVKPFSDGEWFCTQGHSVCYRWRQLSTLFRLGAVIMRLNPFIFSILCFIDPTRLARADSHLLSRNSAWSLGMPPYAAALPRLDQVCATGKRIHCMTALHNSNAARCEVNAKGILRTGQYRYFTVMKLLVRGVSLTFHQNMSFEGSVCTHITTGAVVLL